MGSRSVKFLHRIQISKEGSHSAIFGTIIGLTQKLTVMFIVEISTFDIYKKIRSK